MLEPYWGGALINACIPLQLEMRYCGQCVYCFADLSDPDRNNPTEPILRLLKAFRDRGKDGQYKRQSLAAHLLREGYPVVASNLVDPLSKSNAQSFLAIQSLMELQGVPYSIQTKVAADPTAAYQALKQAKKPIVWYISVTTLDDKHRRRIEPGASSIPDRLQFIRDAIAQGHRVLVGINPVIPELIPDAEAIVGTLKERGVEGIWTQGLHLSAKKQENLTLYGRKALGEDVLAKAKKPHDWAECNAIVSAVRAAADRLGLPTYNGQQSAATSYFRPYRETYQKTYPLMQDFVNHCHDIHKPGDLIFWEEFRDFFVERFPLGRWSLREHFCAIAHRNSLLGLNIPQRMTYEEFLLEAWKHKETVVSPVNVDCFGWAAEWKKFPDGDEGWLQILDNEIDRRPILKFCPEGTNGQAFVEIWGEI
jgi:DNA repair photolyase